MRKGNKFKAIRGKHKAVYGLLLLLIVVALGLAACAGEGGTSSGGGTTSSGETTSQAHNMGGMTGMDHGEKGMPGMAMEMPTVDPETAGLRIDFSSDPAHARPNQSTALYYLITSTDSSTPLTSFPIEHEKPMHLVAASQDLTQFQHIHPEVAGADGAWTVSTTFPEAANYVLFDEFMYNGQEVLDRREFMVGEASPTSASLSPDLSPKTEGGLTESLSVPQSITVGEDTTFTLQVTQDGQPVTDLEPYLGAPAHVVIISSDTRDFAHTHGEVSSMESMDATPPSAFGPDISVHHTFPKAGLYKIWFQFGYQGSVITVPYVVEVK